MSMDLLIYGSKHTDVNIYFIFHTPKKANISFIKVYLTKMNIFLNNTKYECFINYSIIKLFISIFVVM